MSIIFLRSGDTGVAHRIFYGDQIIPVIEHRRRECPAQIMRGALFNTGLLLTHLQDMVHRPVSGHDIFVTQRHGIRSAQTAAQNDGQQDRIPHAGTTGIRLTYCKQRPDFFPFNYTATRQHTAAHLAHGTDMLVALDVHQPQHPGLTGHPLQRREVGVDGGHRPAGVAQHFGEGQVNVL